MPKPKNKKLTSVAKPNPNLSGGHQILKQSLQFLWRYKKFLGAIVLINLGVSVLLGVFASTSLKPIYQGLWFAFASCALLWSIRHAGSKDQVAVRRAYWVGTAPALKFLIATAVLVLTAIPLSVGAFLFGALGWVITDNGPVRALVGLVWVGLSLISLALIGRLILASVIVTLPEIGPFAAIGLSWRLVRGQSFKVARRILILLIYCVGLSVAIALGFGAWPLTHKSATLINQVVSFGLIMPVIYTFLFRLYQELV